MRKCLNAIIGMLRSSIRSQHELALENQTFRQQLVEACGIDERPKYLLSNRDAIYGNQFSQRAHSPDIEEVLTACRSPWQNPCVERIIGSIRRECLDHVVVLGRRHLKRILTGYLDYYNGVRTHLTSYKDSPDRRPVQSASCGRIVETKMVGGSTTNTGE
jgi:putative transposase